MPVDPPVDPKVDPAVDPKVDPVVDPKVDPVVIPATDPSPSTLPSHTLEITPEQQAFNESIPQEYRDKAYLKGVSNIEDVYKKLDGAQELIGKKTIDIPGPDASDVEKEAFYSKVRPATAADYEFKVDDPTKVDQAFTDNVKGLFHKAGLSKAQASSIQEGFDEIIKGIATKKGIDTTKVDADFDKLATDIFGADSDKALESAKALMDKYTPESMKEHVKNLSNENLIILTSVLNGVKKDFINEDDIVNINGLPGTIADIPVLREKAQKIMAGEAFKSTFHKDHTKVQNDLKEIYASIGRLQRAGK